MDRESLLQAKDEDPQTYAIIGAAMEVHSELGGGFLEAVYAEAFAIELTRRGIPFEREPQVRVNYKGHPLNQTYRPDFVVFGEIIIELKAIATFGPAEHAQVVNYLKATGLKRALLINFAPKGLQYRRLVNGY